MRTNKNNQIILNDNDVIHAWLCDNDISGAIFEEPEIVESFNKWCFQQDVDARIDVLKEYTGNDYSEHCISNWHMPEEYYDFDIKTYLLNKVATKEQIVRIEQELIEFESRGLLPVLRFLKYMTDCCEENDIVLGVGRGSSVASYCLYLLGIHRIDSLRYGLEINDFLK
jgi:DNA polymerase III alpha subunit